MEFLYKFITFYIVTFDICLRLNGVASSRISITKIFFSGDEIIKNYKTRKEKAVGT